MDNPRKKRASRDSKIDPAILPSLLHLNAETGHLFWKTRPLSMFHSENACNSWNAKHEGKRFGYHENHGRPQQ